MKGAEESQGRAVAEAVLVFLIAAGLYLPLLSRHLDLNGIAEAVAVDAGDLFMPNHLLYRPLGSLMGTITGFAGFSGRSIVILQVLSALGGAASIGLFYLFCRRLSCSRFVAAAVAFWLATTWAFWAFSTDAMYIPIAAFFVTGAAVALLREGRLSAVVCGALMGLAVTTWEADVLLVPVFMLGVFLFREGTRTARIRLAAHFGWACLLPIIGLYAFAVVAVHLRTPRDLLSWLTSHGGGVTLPMWGAFDWSRVGIAARTLVNSIIFVPLATGAWQVGFALAFPVLLLAGTLITRPRFQWRTVTWLTAAYTVFIPFVVWWDPWEPKWFFVANVFLAAVFGQLLSGLLVVWARRETAVKAGVMLLLLMAGGSNFPAIHDRRYKRNTNLEISRCVASHMQPNDIFITTDWSWGGYLGYYFNRRGVSVIDLAALGGEPTSTLGMLESQVAEVQTFHGNAYMVDMASYPQKHLTWLASQTRLENEDFIPYQGEVAFQCEGINIRRIPFIDDSFELSASSRFRLSVSVPEVSVGEKYKLTISNASSKRVVVRYRLNGGPAKQFIADLGPEGSVEYDISPTTEKGLYEFVSFQIPGRLVWAAADASIRVK